MKGVAGLSRGEGFQHSRTRQGPGSMLIYKWASRASSKEQNWPALTSKSGSEERIPGDLLTGVEDKVEGKGMDFMIIIRYGCYEKRVIMRF